MLTIGEQNAVRDISRAAQKFEKSVEKLIRLEAMKAADPGKYTEEDFIKLLKDE